MYGRLLTALYIVYTAPPLRSTLHFSNYLLHFFKMLEFGQLFLDRGYLPFVARAGALLVHCPNMIFTVVTSEERLTPTRGERVVLLLGPEVLALGDYVSHRPPLRITVTSAIAFQLLGKLLRKSATFNTVRKLNSRNLFLLSATKSTTSSRAMSASS